MIPRKVFQVEKPVPRGNVTQSDLCFRNLALDSNTEKISRNKHRKIKGKEATVNKAPQQMTANKY